MPILHFYGNKMLVLIAYDVKTNSETGQKRLRHIAKACQDYGQRVQFSIFECEVSPAQWVVLKARLIKSFDPDQDSLRFYFLGANWQQRVEHFGAKPATDFDGLLLL